MGARTFKEEALTCDWYDYSNIYKDWGDRPSFICVNLIDTNERPAGKLSDEEAAQGALAELCEYLPDAKTCKILQTRVHRVPNAIHRPVVGTERAQPPAGKCVTVDRLFFAGDWTATELPYCMESAANSGWRAAESLVLAAERQGLKTKGAEGLRAHVPDVDVGAKVLAGLDIFRPLTVKLTNWR